MRQRGRQMTLPTEKGATLMVAAIDAGCCDWGDGKMVQLLMEERAAGCSDRGGGGSVQRRVATTAGDRSLTSMTGDSVRVICGFAGEERKMMASSWEREITSDWRWEGAACDGKKGEMYEKTPDCRLE
ncbi:hypothetical protein BHE74_00041196 [Ensete ventricosum]|nr:hypothetical protein GW17_00043019 [Ensete ventricosum]RWW52381.1 hypothetical protein BHE74_00041196 [Ensete ventricosum]